MKKTLLPHDHGQSIERFPGNIPKPEEFSGLADAFSLLGDGSRLRIFWLLCHCEECVINISALMDMSSPAISHHLKLLSAKGLVVSRRDGKEVYYKAADTEQVHLLHRTIEKMEKINCPPTDSGAGNTELAVRVHEYLSENLQRRISIEDLSRLFLVNTTLLKQSFKEHYGKSIAAYMRSFRAEKAALLLRESSLSIADIALQLGYRSQSKFSAAFKNETGMLPGQYRKMHR